MNPLARHRTLLHDALWTAAVALVVFQGLRRWCGDRYRVPSDSMEPVLHGDPEHGDVVFVDKLAHAAACARGDLVVVWHPEEPRQPLVKRIAASGDDRQACWIDLRDGDVWLGPDKQHLVREVKEPLDAGRRVTWAAWPARGGVERLDLLAAPAGGGVLELPPLDMTPDDLRSVFVAEARRNRRFGRDERALPRGFVGTARAVDATFLERTGAKSHAGDDVEVHDCGMRIELQRCPDQLVAVLDSRFEALTMLWTPASGELLLWRDGDDVTAASLPVVAAPRSIEFGRLDNRLFFAVDGRADVLFVMPRPAAWDAGERGIGGPRCHVYVGARGVNAAAITALQVFHDPFVFRERIAGMPGEAGSWPRFVPPGTWFLLGDNAFDSRDSRHFDAVSRAAFLGRPLAVVGPWPATRWL